jgi:hypothetical protein
VQHALDERTHAVDDEHDRRTGSADRRNA